jgi:hypothetical protein
MPAYCRFMNNQTLVGIELIFANIAWGQVLRYQRRRWRFFHRSCDARPGMRRQGDGGFSHIERHRRGSVCFWVDGEVHTQSSM